MSNIEEGLIEPSVEVEETAKERYVRSQTEEQREVVVTGISFMNELGIMSENFAKVVNTVVADWFDPDKEKLQSKKDELVELFGGSDNLKDYTNSEEFATEFAKWYGVSKAIPILNNIKSYYTRRAAAPRAKKVKYVQISINGEIYNVNASFMEEVKDMSKAERKDAVLNHPDTKKLEVEEF